MFLASRREADDESASKLKQQKSDFSVSAVPVKLLEHRKVMRLVAEDVIEDVQSLPTVESPAFRKLVSIIPVKTNHKLSELSNVATDQIILRILLQ